MSKITIDVIGYHDKPISQAVHADFGDKGGSIGRAPENTLVLLDPERKISRTHATLSFNGTEYILKDQGSLSPVVLNGQPLGNGREAFIEPGDEIRIAGYTMRVRGAEAAAKPVAEERPPIAPSAPPVTASAVSEEAAAATEPSMETELPEPVLSWTSAAQHGAVEAVTTIILAPAAMPDASADGQPLDTPPDHSEAVPPLAPSAIEVAPFAGSAPPLGQNAPEMSAHAPAPSPDSGPGDQELLEALLAGAGIRGIDVPGGLTPERMRQMGALLREATAGLLDLLAARALTKREVRADMTVIVASDNNPLKFSPDREAALTHLLVPRGRGFMPPLRAVSDAYDDLRAHQLGFMAGMKSALSVVLGRFNPETLEKRLIGTTMVDSFLPTHRKAKLWDLFSELYGKISNEAHTDFHALFGQEFLRAYQAHVVKTPQQGEADGKHH
jgi:type VI secretion system FHA domain protein